MAQQVWTKTIGNHYLNELRVIRGGSRAEVEAKADAQLAKWAAREAALRTREAQQELVESLKEQAEMDSADLEARLKRARNVLGVLRNSKADALLLGLRNEEEYPKFTYDVPVPTYDECASEIGVPKENKVAETLMRSRRERRCELEAEAQAAVERKLADYENAKATAREKHDAEERDWREMQATWNNSLDITREAAIRGDEKGISDYLTKTIEAIWFPLDFKPNVQFGISSPGLVVVESSLPSLDDIPLAASYKFVATRKAIDPVPLKAKDRDALFENYVFQYALGMMDYVIRSLPRGVVDGVAFNGWVEGIDAKTGKDFTSCTLSCFASREQMDELDLARVDAKECIRGLKGLFAGRLISLNPVQPVVRLDTSDKRFVESREVLEGLDRSKNLALMDWEDFEHLVRELFGRVFETYGGEVKITRASRDAGVDAVAFDPDPIRGGKFVIQAKRYNGLVPVSAVRDLYGTMINEGAARGILVTTSYYGPDAHSFAADKPIQLVDGQNLLSMLQTYGYGDFNITLQQKEARTDGQLA